MLWNSKACAPQLLKPACYSSHESQTLSPCATTIEACTPRARTQQQEATTVRSPCTAMKSTPPLTSSGEKAHAQQQRPSTAKIQSINVHANLVQSCSSLCDPWTVAHQAPLSMGFSRQKYWSGLPFPSPGDLPDPGTELASLMSPALAGRFFTTSIWEAIN